MSESLYDSYLTQKVELAEQLLQTTRDILDLLYGTDFMPLESLMNRRGQLLEEVDNVDRIYREDCELNSPSCPVHNRPQIARLKEIFLGVQELDEKIKVLIPVRQQHLTQEYNLVKNVRKVQNAYENQSGQGVFVDKER